MLLKGEIKGSNEWERKVASISSSSFSPPIEKNHQLFGYDDAESNEDITFDFNAPPATSVASPQRDSRHTISLDTVMDVDVDPLLTTADESTILAQQQYAASAFGTPSLLSTPP